MSNANPPLRSGLSVRWVMVDDRSRKYLLHVPNSYRSETPTPAVLAFHGGGTTAEHMVGFSGLSDKANDAGFLVVYPCGSGRDEQFLSWNGGNCCGHAQRYDIDDVKYVDTLLNDLCAVANIDSRRVFATGMSNGALMAYRLASELSHRIAAIAPVAGPMGFESCSPERPVPVLHFHGTEDLFTPYEGGKGRRSMSRTDFNSVAHSINCWLRANACPSPSQVVRVTPNGPTDLPVTIETYGPGKDDSEVVLVTIHGGGHTWPGRVPDKPYLGPTTLNISASDMMWEFFSRHPIS